MDGMLAVEHDGPVVDESFAAPAGRDPQRVLVEDHPISTSRDAAGPGIQPDRNSLVGEVRSVGADLVGRGQVRPIVHRHPRLELRRRRSPRVTLGQTGQISLVNRDVLPRVQRLQVGLADVVDCVVLLLRDHPGLRYHQVEAMGERFVHAMRIAAVAELIGGETQRRGQRTGLVFGAMAVHAQSAIDRFAPLVALLIQVGDHAGVIDVLFILRQRRSCIQRRLGLELQCPLRAAFGDLHHIAHQIQKLLSIGQLVHKHLRHHRLSTFGLIVDLVLGDSHQFAVLGRIAQYEPVGMVFGQQAGHGQSVVGDHDDRFVALTKVLRGTKDRIDQKDVGRFLRGFLRFGQVGAQYGRILGRVLIAERMALGTSQILPIKQDRPPSRLTLPSSRLGQGRRIFLEQLFLERRRLFSLLLATGGRQRNRRQQKRHQHESAGESQIG